jgi:regulator of replication initiation timing
MPDQSPLDPTHYVEHVTRTALLLEQLARDVKALRDQTETSVRDTSGLRMTMTALEKELAVFKSDTQGKIETNKFTIENLADKIQWLTRVVAGTLITSIVGGLVALIYKLVGQ